MKVIESEAFSDCDLGLTAIAIPEGVERIGSFAFNNCSNAAAVAISSTVTYIGEVAFRNCPLLTELTIPNNVQTICGGAFGGCISLKKLTVPFIGRERGNNGRDAYEKARFPYLFGTESIEGTYVVPKGWNSSDRYVPESLAEVVVTDETVVGTSAFARCAGLKKVVLDCAVTNVDAYAFLECTGLDTVVFTGSAPKVTTAFGGVSSDCVVKVVRGSTGWGVDIPGTWRGLRIEYIDDDVLPSLSEAEGVGAVLRGFADAAVPANVVTLGQYDAFREWAYAVRGRGGAVAGTAAVRDSPFAWRSFALGASALLEREVAPDDIRVVSLAVGGGRAARELSFEVAIDGVEIGGGRVDADTLGENLKKVLGVEGAASPVPEAFSSDGIELSFGLPADGRVKATVVPPAGAKDGFFMRVKVK